MPPFLWVGNHPATDLCNTTPVVDGQRLDLLADPASVGAWLDESAVTDVLFAALTADEQRRVASFVHRLRDALRVALEHGTVDRLNDVLLSERGVLQVTLVADEPVRLAATSPAAQLRLDLAAATLDIFRHDPAFVRRCANPSCVLLFLDVSKSGRRRWCDMATCGNRAKSAAHHARARHERAAT